ncbi:MAG TPA: hypothetical protein VFS39_02040 [Nitrospira sp.]|nr:hypothetical protein [Nitrospira sp.]
MQRWTAVWALCGAAALAAASFSAAEEPTQDKRPRVELSAGTWISVGDTRWAHDASSQGFGNPTSKLIYKDVGTNVIDLTGKVWASRRLFAKLNVGFADIGGGRLTDNDYGAGQQLFSQTTSNISGDSMWYLNADVGARVKEFAHSRGYLDVFGGYQYWHTKYQAVGVFQVACNPGAIPAIPPCDPPGTDTNQGQTVITNTTNWHSLRVGASSEYRVTRYIGLYGTVALIPVSILDNKDVHHLRSDLQQNPSFSMTGYGVGADVDVGGRVTFTRNIAASVGYRLYYNRVLSGHLTNHPVSGASQSFPLTQFESLRHGLTAALTLIF